VRLNVYRFRRLLLHTVGPLAFWSLRRLPLWTKFRRIPGGYQTRTWFKRAVVVSGAFEAMRQPSKDLDLLANAKEQPGH
jgi:hypothetical protein